MKDIKSIKSDIVEWRQSVEVIAEPFYLNNRTLVSVLEELEKLCAVIEEMQNRQPVSPVSENPGEEAFYEKCEAAVKVACVVFLLLIAGCATGPHKPPTEPIYSPFYNPNTGGVWVHGTLKDGTNWRTQAAQLGLVPTTVMGVEVWYNPQAVAPLNAEVHSRDYWAGYVAGEAEARSAFDRAMMRRTNSPNIRPNRPQ